MHSTLEYLAAIVTCTLFAAGASAQSTKDIRGPAGSVAIADDKASPIFGVTIPAGYRQWELIAPSQETGTLDELRAILGNGVSMKAYREGTLPFPDGAILVKLAWKHVPSTEFPPAFVPGPAMTVQVMVKDAKRYASTGGWGFGRFLGGKPVDEAQHKTCFACHAANVKGHDFVFTRYAP
jgi:Cytochrome P460